MLEPIKNGRHQGSTSRPRVQLPMFIVVKCEDHLAIQAPPKALPDNNLKMPGTVFFCYKSIQKSMKPAYLYTGPLPY